MVSVSVVIPTKNAGPEFRQVLECIRNQGVSDLEIVVIDSGSIDNTVDVAREKADKVLEIPPDEFHHGKTRNVGAEQTSGDVIVFTVQDALPVNDEWLSELIKPIKSGKADVTYGNQIAYPDAKPPVKFFYEYFYPDEPVALTEKDTTDRSSFYMDNIFLSDVSSAVSRGVWNEFQFRESVAMSEDKDFAYRVASAGYAIQYCPKAKVNHSHDYTVCSLFRRRYKDGKAFKEITGAGSDNFASNGFKYVWNKYSHLVQSNSVHWMPYTIAYDFIYFIAFTLGKHYQRLPITVDQWIDR